MFYCFFEQSGTFKNEFIKLGYPAVDVDFCDGFGETDIKIDLFNEIWDAYKGKKSIFDKISFDDFIIAFFPCVRFSNLFIYHFNLSAPNYKDLTDLQRISKCMNASSSVSYYFETLCMLVSVCFSRGIPLVIENPYNTQGYLYRYFCFKPSIIDLDRRKRGDYYKKPTQYFFFNCEPKNHIILEVVNDNSLSKGIQDINGFQRSLIHPDYANRFIREFII